MSDSSVYGIAGTKNTAAFASGWWSNHDEAIDVARRYLDQWIHEDWVRVKRHEGKGDWSPVAIVYRHRVDRSVRDR